VNLGLLIGTFNEPTDRAPNGAEPLTTVPEPASAVLLTFGGALAAGVYSRRRKGR
jgi:hypothetical protein